MNQNDTIPVNSQGIRTETESDVPEELDRVREIILGPDPLRQRLRHAEVDRLREILFGAQIEEYERRFADLRREVQRIASDVDDIRERLADLEKTMARRLETLELDTRKLADDLRRESDRQRSRETLLQQIATQVRQHDDSIKMTGETLSDLRKSYASHEAELRSVRAGMIDVRDQIEQRVQATRREIRHTEDELRAELRRIAERLDYQKTDRKALASMLIELAARLETGSTVTDMLEGLHAVKE
jgi:chromosome segregation ATPase